jgi:hypothetical protein
MVQIVLSGSFSFCERKPNIGINDCRKIGMNFLGTECDKIYMVLCTVMQCKYNNYRLKFSIADLLFKIQCVLPPDDELFLKHVDILIKNNAVEDRTCVSYYLRLDYNEKFDNFQCH